MSHPVFWPTKSFFYPIGNTSPVNLLQHIPPRQDASLLLLGCGDPRNILYTIYSSSVHESTKKIQLDFTCCDWEPAILARNVLLLSLLWEADYDANRLKIWNIFYHFLLDPSSLSLLVTQCQKLASMSTDFETWNASPYSSFIRIANLSTLQDLHRLWALYADMPSLPSSRRKQLNEQFMSGMKETHRRGYAEHIDGTAARSAGPLAVHARLVPLGAADHFWRTGVTHTDPKDIKAAINVNPTFAYSNEGEGFMPHYATSVLSAFHLAPIHASTSLQPHSGRKLTLSAVYENVRGQFRTWCSAFRQYVGPNPEGHVVIRVAVGDALAFCRTLSDATTGAPALVRVSAWRASMFDLDGPDYQSKAAPTLFDVIDTTNLCDHLGTLNLLIATTALLKCASTSVLYTEKLLSSGDNPMAAFADSLCGDLTTMSLLLDISPISYLSGYTTHSNIHEVVAVTIQEDHQYHERVVWRIPSQLGGPAPSGTLRFDEAELARLLFGVYLKMFAVEDHSGWFGRPNISLAWIRNRNKVHYSRNTLALLIRRLTYTVRADWDRVMDDLVESIIADRSLMIGINYLHDFMTQAYLLGLYNESKFVLERRVLTMNKPLGPFHDWRSTPPPVVCVVFTVPRAKLAILDREDAPPTPNFMVEISSMRTISNNIATIDTLFGAVNACGEGEGAFVVIDEDPLGKRGKSPVVVIVNVPTWMLTYNPPNTELTLAVVSTPHTTSLVKDLGLRLSLCEVPLMDPTVHVLKKRPALAPSSSQAIVPAARHKFDAIPNTITAKCMGDSLSTITRRVDIQDQKEKEALASKDTIVKVHQLGPCSLQLMLGVTPSNTVAFPFVVEGSKAKVRVARQSSWVEIVVPPTLLWCGGRAGEIKRRFPVIKQGNLVLPWNIHYLPLDRLPVLSTAQKKQLDWLNPHVSLAFSDRENNGRASDSMDALAHVKNSLHSIFCHASGVQGELKTGLFGLNRRGNGGIDTMLFITDLRLDLPNHTVVADAFVLPLNDPLVERLGKYLGNATATMCQVVVNDEECIAWKALLPSLVERCRTWEHTPNCAYDHSGATIPLSFEHGEVPICDCGQGKVTASFRQRKEWQPFLPFVTRVAISPIFAVPFIESVGGRIRQLASGSNPNTTRGLHAMNTRNMGEGSPHAFGTRTTGLGDEEQLLSCQLCQSSFPDGKPMRCSRCKKAAYCGKECQIKDWKSHKKECQQV